MAKSQEVTTQRVQDLLRDLASRTPVQQAIVGLESGDRSSSWFGAMGENPGGTQVRASTPFFVASIDKLFNAAVVMKLSEAGQLELDATISTYLPRPLTLGLHRLGGIDYSAQITLRHLLGHTSGLAD